MTCGPAPLARRLAAALAATVLAAPTLRAADGPASRPAEPPINVILVSWDGVDRRLIKELLDANKLPHLAALIRQGSLQDIDITGHPTTTKPGHAVMLTGLDPATTGVYSNGDYRAIPRGYTIFERVRTHLGGPAAVRTIMIASKTENLGGRSAKEAGGDPDGPDDPYFLTRKALDVFNSSDRVCSDTGPIFLRQLQRHKDSRFLAFVHFADPDQAGHQHGSDSTEYRDAAIACDRWLGRIVEWLRQSRLADRTLVYVATDHGFDSEATSHHDAPDGWLATNDKAVVRGGTLADVPATVLWRFGLDVAGLRPKLAGKPLVAAPATSQPAATQPTPRPRAKRAAGARSHRVLCQSAPPLRRTAVSAFASQPQPCSRREHRKREPFAAAPLSAPVCHGHHLLQKLAGGREACNNLVTIYPATGLAAEASAAARAVHGNPGRARVSQAGQPRPIVLVCIL